jgi:phenylpropionate dioxygenase-like ring-hydroxylating dioxygenase large terminal subunit
VHSELSFLPRRFLLVCTVDAVCGHLGANLAHGTVKQECIECPFHKWQFDGDGCVKHIPYAGKTGSCTPAKFTQKSFPCIEWCDSILFWYHADPELAQQPTYHPPPLRDLYDSDGSLRHIGNFHPRNIHMHLQEFVEHFACLHQKATIPWTTIEIPCQQKST